MYYVKNINCTHKVAESILKNLLSRESSTKPVKGRQEDVVILTRCFKDIRSGIMQSYPEIRTKYILLYLFDESEGKRNQCNGECNRFGGKMFSIGLSERVLHDEDKLKYCILHEIAHLQYFEHTPRFYELLDFLRYEYSLQKGVPMPEIYEDRERAISEWRNKKK